MCKHRPCNRRQGSKSGTGISSGSGARMKLRSSSTSACGRRMGEYRIDLHTIHASNQLRGRWASAKTIDDVHASYCYKGQATRIVCNESCEACGPERYGCHRTGQELLKRLPSQGWETESWVDGVRSVLAGGTI